MMPGPRSPNGQGLCDRETWVRRSLWSLSPPCRLLPSRGDGATPDPEAWGPGGPGAGETRAPGSSEPRPQSARRRSIFLFGPKVQLTASAWASPSPGASAHAGLTGRREGGRRPSQHPSVNCQGYFGDCYLGKEWASGLWEGGKEGRC